MKIIVIKESTVVEVAFEDSEDLTTISNGGKTWFMVDGARYDARPSNEYTVYTDITLPSGYKDEKFKYDGTTFTANPDYIEDTTYWKVIDGVEWLCDKDDEGVEHMIYANPIP